MGDGTALRVGVIGAAVSANKGAASMFYGLVDGLASEAAPLHIELLTTYPSDDRASLDTTSLPGGVDVTIRDASPVRLLLAFIVALPIRLLDRIGIPIGPFGFNRLVRSVRSTDVVVDLAGISFADGRGVPLLGYNSVMSLFPHLAGARVVKGSQALGPMRKPATRFAAGIVLPRMAMICARGSRTRSHLDQMGLTNVVDAADISFLMSTGVVPDGLPAHPDDGHVRIVVMPSSVVDGYAARSGIDHIGVLASTIERLSTEGHEVIVVPHSYRSNGERSRMNDGPIVSDLEAAVPPEAASFINVDLDPRSLRAIAGSADLVITGRFHGMVSSLEVGTIPVVIGWSHKYGEVLDQFGVPDQGIAVEDLTSDRLVTLVEHSLADRAVLEGHIAGALDGVNASSQVNIDVIRSVAVSG